MKRRGFLGLLGGAAVAGPGMVKQAVASAPIGIEAMGLGALQPNYMEAPYGSSIGLQAAGSYDHAKWLKDRIAEVVGISQEERARRMAQIQPSTLDPDLAVNRSMSLTFKVAEQKRRILQRSLDAEHRSLARDLAEHLKRELL